jgi:ribosomal protein S19
MSSGFEIGKIKRLRLWIKNIPKAINNIKIRNKIKRRDAFYRKIAIDNMVMKWIDQHRDYMYFYITKDMYKKYWKEFAPTHFKHKKEIKNKYKKYE